MADEFETAAMSSTADEGSIDTASAPLQVEAPTVDGTQATDDHAEGESLQAKYDAATKELQRLKSISGSQRRQADIAKELKDLRDEVGSLRKTQFAWMARDEELKPQIEAIQSDVEKQTNARSWDTAYAKASGMLQEALYDGDVRVLDPAGLELREAAQAWNAARAAEDREGLLEAVHLANLARRRYDRQAAAKAQEPKEPAPKKGPGIQMATVPGGPASAERTRFTREDLAKMTPEEYAKAREHLVK